MTRAEVLAFNRGVAALAAIAATSADVLTVRITEAPTRFNFAIGALEGLVEAAADLMLPIPPGGTATAVAALPLQLAPAPTQIPVDVAGQADVKPTEKTAC